MAFQPSVTGPVKLDKLVPRERAELVKNATYWDTRRLAKTDRIILLANPEALTRANALLSGQVDLIEAPPPDVLEQLKKAGFKVVTNAALHFWVHHFNT